MNAPNLITMSRLVLTVGVFVCLELVTEYPAATLGWWAFWMFVVAALTDFVDGWLARRFNQVSMFGRVFDPFADKVLICGTFIVLLRFEIVHPLMPTWFVVVIVGRELLVTTVRGAAEARGIAFPAERLGKYKMLAQCVTAGALLTVVAGAGTFVAVAQWGMWVTLVLTVMSGGGYLWKARALLTSA